MSVSTFWRTGEYILMDFMVAPRISNIKYFVLQLMHTNYKILRLLKYLKLWKLLQQVSVHIKPSSGSHIQCLAKITYLVPMCVLLYSTHIGTRYIILAKHWIWLPDDGFMWIETFWSSFYNFNYFNNLRILQFVCISWKIKCLILLL